MSLIHLKISWNEIDISSNELKIIQIVLILKRKNESIVKEIEDTEVLNTLGFFVYMHFV